MLTETARKHVRNRMSEIDARQKDLVDAAKESGNVFSDAQREEFDKLQAEYDALKLSIAPSPRKTGPDSNYQLGRAPSELPTQTPAADPRRGNRGWPGAAKLFGVERPTNNGFESFRDFAHAVAVGDSQRMMVSGASSGNAADGGYLVAEQHAFAILDKAAESEIVRPRCMNFVMDADNVTIATFDDSTHASGELFGGLSGTWIAEGDSLGSYQVAQTRRVKLQAKKWAFLSAATNELLSDQPQYEGLLEERMAKAAAWNFDRTCLITGTGAGTPRSVLNDPALITVAKAGGQAADTFLYINALNMLARLHPGCWGNAVWVVNQTVLPQLMSMSVDIGTAGDFVPAMTNVNGRRELLGLPILFSEKMNPLGDLGDVLLVDLSQYCIGLVRNSMRFGRSEHVKFETDETVFRMVLRADGQGLWKQAFQPVNGDTLSWCVTLAAR